MARQFNTPEFYTSSEITELKKKDRGAKRDFTPFTLSYEGLQLKLARRFGFCYGVENAIEIAYRAVSENPGKRIFLLSEMIHNPIVNEHLLSLGVHFLQKPDGTRLIPFSELVPEDIVILPAFGVTVETFDELSSLGIDPKKYDATCPFVEKVWRRANQLGEGGFTVVIHGKHFHEETRATFSHASITSPSVIVRNREETERLGLYILGKKDPSFFFEEFQGKYTPNFSPERDLIRLGVVNQTTMLAEETRDIGEYIRSLLIERYGEEHIQDHFADTRDTLCYATSENQSSVKALIESGGDVAIVVGGYNSSNTGHLAKLCSTSVPTFHIEGAKDIVSRQMIRRVNFDTKEQEEISGWFPNGDQVTILLTAGASTPDSIVQEVITRIREVRSSR